MTQTATKMPTCCARAQSRVTMAKADLGRLAQKAARADQRNRDITKLRDAIAEAKRIVAMAEEAVVDHEADHAA